MTSSRRPDKPEPRPSGIYAALFLVSASAVLWEILLTRIYSTVLHYHFAFMAVSIAMFGMTAGAVAVLLARARLASEKAPDWLARLCLAAGIAMAAAVSLQLAMPVRFELPAIDRGYLIATYLLSALPFLPAGAFTTLALTRFEGVGTLYACDLAGAGLACAVLPPLLRALGGPGAAVAAGAAGCAAAFALWRTRRPRSARAALLCAAALAAFAGANAKGQWLRVRWARSGAVARPLYERWNVYSRVMVSPIGNREPFGWATDPELVRRAPPIDQLVLTIDSGAATPITRWNGELGKLAYLQDDLTAFAHRLRSRADVLVIGPGGGRDILAALTFGQASVRAVEVNDSVADAVNGPFGNFAGHLDRLPQVRFVTAEGRGYVERTPDRFDIIQASLVDTAAATAGGAYALVENGLYTVEAWELFLRRLKPRGILTVSRAFSEMYRTAALAGAALRGLGVTQLERHVIMVRLLNGPKGAGVGTILVSRDPFSRDDLARARQACKKLRCEIALSAEGSQDPVMPPLLAGATEEELRGLPVDVSPPTDDRPFFFFTAKLADVLRGGQSPAAEVLVSLTAWSLALGLGLILLPPLWLSMRGAWRGTAPNSPPALPAYFAAIGLAFMFVEVGLIQRLSLFLGHPTLGFTVALFAILLFSGFGSLASERAGGAWPLAALTALLIAAESASLAAVRGAMGAPQAARVALSVLLIAPPALLMGFAFPLGMRLVRKFDDGRGAWYWAINGASGVIASVLAMECSLGWGIRRTLWVGILLYGAAALLYRACARAKAA
ncbi:MAG: hypothetical protein HY077_07045 [Elusimicrobia bacterium]|nr:hypothetical protein [Elusimicrobiota bacterium]